MKFSRIYLFTGTLMVICLLFCNSPIGGTQFTIVGMSCFILARIEYIIETLKHK
jgi:hypothetical protein